MNERSTDGSGAPQSSTTDGPHFSIKIMNTAADIYWGNVYLNFISPFNLILLGLFGLLVYSLAIPSLRQDQIVLFLIVVACEAIVILAIIHAIPLLVLAYGYIFNKLQGVLGEHEFAFEADQFIERTVFNEAKSSKSAINRILETGKGFFVVLPGPQAHLIPKRDLSAVELANLRRHFNEIRPVRRFLGPFVGLMCLVASILFVGVATQFSSYETQRDVLAFQACWDEQSLYLFGGEQYYGTTYKYGDMLLDRYDNMESATSSEFFLWTVGDGKVQKHALGLDGYVGSLVLNAGKLYLSVYDESRPEGAVLLWSGERFLEHPEMSAEGLAELVSQEAEPNCLSWFDQDSWRVVTGGADTFEVPLMGGAFILTHQATVQDEETWARDISLSGVWAGSPGEEVILLQARTGPLELDGEEFEARFRR